MPKHGSAPSRPRRSAERIAMRFRTCLGILVLFTATDAGAQSISSGLAKDTSPSNIAAMIGSDGIAASLTGRPGDPARGRAIVADRQKGLCLLCHAGPIPEQRSQGDLAPDLDGAGARWSQAQLRLRIVDSRRINPDSIMPSFFRTDGLTRVAPVLAGKPVLTAEEVEDVVAYLETLQ